MDELYTIARRSLLDALEALGAHRDATVLVRVDVDLLLERLTTPCTRTP